MAQQSKLTDTIMQWQQSQGRHNLPWQQTITPYKVHVSEIMLQQTQVATVIPYFQRWMALFPDLETLAAASEDEVMTLWQGLGYYTRARNLRKAAQYLNEQHQGQYPDDLKALEAIPGVGRYTAGAIRSFAFNSYGPIVDGNVKRLFARLFGIYGEPNKSSVNKEFWQQAERLTPPDNSKAFAQGVLDLGATVCKRHNPLCTECPVQADCFAFEHDCIEHLPSAKKSKVKPVKDAHFLWHTQDNKLLFKKRPSPGIWGGLWCLPEQQEAPENASLLGQFTHQFSHYSLQASVWQLNNVQQPAGLYQNTRLQPISELQQIGLPTPVRRFIEDIQTLV
ncbi:A/G-specific adenine glycosylase [Aliidiomarina minuta]|uniref:Adenine DNA glycosylase n=1 Tax=Aliidiomarina minuta TaxID=880057 RepID=A0A432W1F6_9GAMM|nr:A/G-specific adenine glycosylase [Aliidiomarina minuta]RUO22956.1 A/G-specific adenine glycosylase [Aliidiomarina minuta]